MPVRRASLLNRLLHELPERYVVDAAWLSGLGLGASSIRDYVRRGWLERVGSRLYRRPEREIGKPVRWEIAMLSLQMMAAPLHVGGMSALELAGYWQYAPLGRRRIWLYTDSPAVRSYLRRLDLDADIDVRSRKLFGNADPDLGVESRALDLVMGALGPVATSAGSTVPHRQHLSVASLERAILETLEEVPKKVSFQHGAEQFEGLTTLRPKLMEALLLECRSVKAKRLFLYFSGQHRHAWARRLQTGDIDIGSGKRQIIPGGKLDSEYLITVPRSEKHEGAPRAS
ncbi:type IV toxin-antitoxin system AbiEi family antitoxin domain-containing protein [Sphingomonas glacialis]|uniref:Transcriptional regulator AbiEi antitoxin N-terminal domain-containing protein n=1 Tax=Sphingomonas glacialis TaxID=658225 RepID=A0A502FZH2_9SPHN|nr:type IV toxin-antitoxin system AbiEi family antitoxin domain-containing protein [Sphingomonas glacialis]TPG55047.1 hypothetical protein EAH76_10770 [Sphingomonas glacialis]